MKKKKLDRIWDNIEYDLILSYKESNRDAIVKAIHNLPQYKAPEKVWTKIENQLNINSKVGKRPRFFLMAAALSLIIGFSFILVLNKGTTHEKIHYTQAKSNSNNFYEIADTSSSVLTKIISASCGINPVYCASAEFKDFQKEYKTLEHMQVIILKKASSYDNEKEVETMLIKIENQKKSIEQHLIDQINS